MVAGDHWLDVPLDHRAPDGPALTIYARELRSATDPDAERPYLVFLQGGPGGRAPRPGADAPAWVEWAVQRYRVVMLDQRGTGRSTPQDRRTLLPTGERPDTATVRRLAEHLALFRADSIVDDAEALRRHLLGDQPWTVLGQSFGGFCTWTYLSRAPEGLTAALVTGGVPPMGAHPDDVYRATSRALARRTADLDAAHPAARAVLADVADHLERCEELLPTGERLTTARLQEVGGVLGAATGPDRLALLAEDAWALPGRLSDTFLAGVAEIVSYAGRPLYALVHEAAYAEGLVTGWSAQRVREEVGPAEAPVTGDDGVARLPLTGEMVYPHTLARDPALAGLAEVAEALAERVWTEPLYDPQVLARSRVPVAACVYTQDMYVDPGLSLATAAVTGHLGQGGCGPGTGAVQVVEDREHHHDGLRRAGPQILDALAARLGDAVPGPRQHQLAGTGSVSV